MKICNCTAKLALLALIAAGLLAVPPEKSQAQEPENYAWITNTNGITWKREIDSDGDLYFSPPGYSGWGPPPAKSDKPKIASILVPEHAIINFIDVNRCVNLTNIIIQPAIPRKYTDDGRVIGVDKLRILADLNTDIRNITCQKTMRDLIVVSRTNGWWPLQWTELKLPKMEIRTHATANGTEVEIVWRDGKLQIADAVNGEYRDHLGQSPLRFPLAAAKDKQFFRIARIESPTTEEPPTPR